ncbi:hypothetical protein, partial [Nocardia wallacei]|uniref:hypothetical protein n=1 Tax=Nocardia wallacei TaxID=480035 RepID=UPI002458AA28
AVGGGDGFEQRIRRGPHEVDEFAARQRQPAIGFDQQVEGGWGDVAARGAAFGTQSRGFSRSS